jgi:hypothetical protein
MSTNPNNEAFGDGRFQFSSPGLGKTGQYQMSGIPFVSASITVNPGGEDCTVVNFPYVTKFVTVQNIATGSEKPLRVGFTQFGTTGSAANDGFDNYFVLDNGESYTGELRVTKLFLLGAERPIANEQSCLTSITTASVIAGLTGINSVSLLTNWSGTSGVG